jgi:hypothetical protein
MRDRESYPVVIEIKTYQTSGLQSQREVATYRKNIATEELPRRRHEAVSKEVCPAGGVIYRYLVEVVTSIARQWDSILRAGWVKAMEKVNILI